MEDLRCFECFYSQFGHCPVSGSYNNAACIVIRKSYFDMPRKELERVTEEEYKKSLQRAAQLWHIRMDYIKNIFDGKEEEEEQDETLH